jgi:hydrogenase maturation protease
VNRASVQIIGLGSNRGLDRTGWDVISRLKILHPSQGYVQKTIDPLAVVDIAPECQLLIIVDACMGTGSPGTIHRFEWPDSQLMATTRVSSHGVGLVESLRLGEELGKLPARVVVFAIEIASCEPGLEFDPRVEAAIPRVIEMILAEAAPETPEN